MVSHFHLQGFLFGIFFGNNIPNISGRIVPKPFGFSQKRKWREISVVLSLGYLESLYPDQINLWRE